MLPCTQFFGYCISFCFALHSFGLSLNFPTIEISDICCPMTGIDDLWHRNQPLYQLSHKGSSVLLASKITHAGCILNFFSGIPKHSSITNVSLILMPFFSLPRRLDYGRCAVRLEGPRPCPVRSQPVLAGRI